MKALAVLFFLLGVAALLQRPAEFSHEEASHRAIAVNYAIYRNEVFLHVYANRGLSGDIPLSTLNMPESWQALRAWRSRVDGGRCYVYGEASQEEIAAVRDLFHGSFAIGMASNGRLIPVQGNAIALPSFIPNGCLVSVTEVD